MKLFKVRFVLAEVWDVCFVEAIDATGAARQAQRRFPKGGGFTASLQSRRH